MNDLPWLVVHGALVWKAALVLFACAGAALAWIVSMRTARHAAAEARRSLGKARDRLDAADLEKQVTLIGRLVVAGQRCRRFEDGAEVAAAGAAVFESSVNVRAAELRLEMNGATVLIDGPVEVIAGSREAHPRRALTQLGTAVRNRVLEVGGLPWFDSSIVLRSLDAGDQVVASGLLRRGEATGEEGGYRVSAGSFILAPAPRRRGPASPISLAYDGTPRIAKPWRRLVSGALLGGVAFCAVFGVGAEIVGKVMRPGSSARAAIWAATPLRRANALAELVLPLKEAATLDGHDLERLIGLDLLRDRCDEAAADLSDRGRFARSAELGERCGAPAAAAQAAFEGGDFARSSRDAVDAQRERTPGMFEEDAEAALCMARAHLLAGELGRAATEVRRAEQIVSLVAGDAITLACVADALDARAGSAAALEKLRVERQHNWTTECALAVADLLDAQERIELLDRFSEQALRARGQTSFNVASLLMAEVDPGGPGLPAQITTPLPDRVLTTQTGGVDYRVMGVAGAVLGKLAADPAPRPALRRLRAVLGASRAVFDVSTEAWDESRRWVELAVVDAEPLQESPEAELRARVSGVLTAVPLRFPPREPRPTFKAETWFFPALDAMMAVIQRRDAMRLEVPALSSLLDASAKRQVALVLAGSSKALARALEDDPPYGPALRLLGPEVVVEDRAALDRWLHSGRVKRSHKCDLRSRLSDLGARLSLAEVVGSDLEIELRASLTAFRSGLLRRETSVPLALLDAFLLPGESRP